MPEELIKEYTKYITWYGFRAMTDRVDELQRQIYRRNSKFINRERDIYIL